MITSGTYVFKLDGEEIARSKNVITNAGKDIIASYMAGTIGEWAGAFAIGVGATTAAVTDAKLDFEFYRAPISSKVAEFNTSPTPNKIVIKSSVDQSVVGWIYEVGIFSAVTNSDAGNGGSQITSYGETSESWSIWTGTDWENVDSGTTGQRIGDDRVELLASTRYRLYGVPSDYTMYSPQDTIAACLESPSTSDLNLKFITDDSNYYSATVTSIAASYGIFSVSKGSFVATGTPSWGNIIAIEFEAVDDNVLFDGLRVEDTDTQSTNYGLVSRSVLTSPIEKKSGALLEIEYYVDSV